MWQRLQLANSLAPNARLPLWQAEQLAADAGAKCIEASGFVTWRPVPPARTEWQLAQLRPALECRVWLKLMR